jgi:hypothetical protein
LRPDRRDERARHGNLGGVRQWIESVFDTLQGQLALERHGGRTCHEFGTRVAQRLFALAVAVWHNLTIDASNKRDRAALLRTDRAAHARFELLRLVAQLPELEVTELAQLWTVLDVPEDLSAIDET